MTFTHWDPYLPGVEPIPVEPGMGTPWGAAQFVDEVAPGLVRIGTASHGGLLLDERRVAALPPSWRPFVSEWLGDAMEWAEEDVEAALLSVYFDIDGARGNADFRGYCEQMVNTLADRSPHLPAVWDEINHAALSVVADLSGLPGSGVNGRWLADPSGLIRWHVAGGDNPYGIQGAACHCPITAVYAYRTGQRVDVAWPESAGRQMGMSEEAVHHIAHAADVAVSPGREVMRRICGVDTGVPAYTRRQRAAQLRWLAGIEASCPQPRAPRGVPVPAGGITPD